MTATIDEILAWLGNEPTFARVVSAARKLETAAGDDEPPVRFALLRNVTVEPGLPAALAIEAARAGLRASIYLGPYDAVQQDVFDPRSAFYESKPEIVVLLLRLHTLTPRLVYDFTSLAADEIDELVASTLDRVMAIVNSIRSHTSAAILVHNVEMVTSPAFGILDAASAHGQQNTFRRLNLDLARRVAEIPSGYVVDLDRVLARLGYDKAMDDRYWHIGRAPYRFEVYRSLAREYVTYARALKGKTKKCLVLDCDNTLWGGVVGEDGLGGIRLGASHPGSAYLEFHAAILDLYRRGVLLALNSKNNESDVLEVLEKHPDSLIRTHHVVARRINWQDKVTNLRELAAELNIGLDSLVFVDDSPFECRYVREALPEVTVVELPADPTSYARILRDMPYFETLTLSQEDRRRSAMYAANAQRGELQRSSGSLDEYLRSLQMVLTVVEARPFDVPRISQLTQKTNQFNTTTRRYSETEIAAMVREPSCRVYAATLEDRFDNAGLIAVAIVRDHDDEARIDVCLMSCRVIGRGVEDALVARIAADARDRGVSSLIGEFIPSAKNVLVRDLYARLGFNEQLNSEGRWWAIDLKSAKIAVPGWFDATTVTGEVEA